MSMQEDIDRLKGTGAKSDVFVVIAEDFAAEHEFLLQYEPGTLRKVTRSGLGKDGEPTQWNEYKDAVTGETLGTFNEGNQCPPLDPIFCE